MIADDEAIERVARAMCEADFQDPDRMVFEGQPYLTRYGFAVPSLPAYPMWHDYRGQAKAAIDAVEQLPPDYLEKLCA